MEERDAVVVAGYKLPKYSVLMSVYEKELPENLNQSLESMLKQTYPPSDFVLVCDGKLTNALDVIVKSFQNEYKDIFRIVRIDENVGAGKAVNKGIKACRYEYIVRMDSDDVSLRGRCLKEMLMNNELFKAPQSFQQANGGIPQK